MPSFDAVSETDMTEVKNAANQVRKELQNRFDFKGAQWEMVEEKDSLVLQAESEFRLQAVVEILMDKLARRSVNLKNVDRGKLEISPTGRARQVVTFKQGIEPEIAKQIVAEIKGLKLKVQSQIEGTKVRVSGKNRDDLQQVMAHLRSLELPLALSFGNFRD